MILLDVFLSITHPAPASASRISFNRFALVSLTSTATMEKYIAKTEDLEASTSSIESERGNVASGTLSSWGRNVLLSVETRGIERVTEEERQYNTTKIWNTCTFW